MHQIACAPCRCRHGSDVDFPSRYGHLGGNDDNEVAHSQVDGQILFDCTIAGDLFINVFALAGTGLPDDLADVTFRFTKPKADRFSVTTQSGISAGTLFLPWSTYAVGDFIRLIFDDGVSQPIGVGVSFGTSVAPVPLPAAGGILLFTIVGGAEAAMCQRAMA